MKRKYATSIILHVLILLLILLFPLLNTSKKMFVEQAIIIDFSLKEDSQSTKAVATKAPKSAKQKKSSSKSKPTRKKTVSVKKTKKKLESKTEIQKDKVLETVKKKVIQPRVPTAAEVEAVKKQQERAAKKSAFSALLSKSKKKVVSGDNSLKEEKGSSTVKRNEAATGNSNIRGILGNRKVLKVPTIKDDSQKKGRVVVKICVNAKGDVMSSTYTMMGSTTSDSYLIGLAEKGAKEYKFSISSNPKECGKVVIDFLLK